MCSFFLQVSQQLQEHLQAAAARAAGLEAEAMQLQQQLLQAQTEAEEAHAAAKLRQIEHESQAQELMQVRPKTIVAPITVSDHRLRHSLLCCLSQLTFSMEVEGQGQRLICAGSGSAQTHKEAFVSLGHVA